MLTLTLLAVDGQNCRDPEERTLDTGQIRLGRGPENDWILTDPGNILSRQHCIVRGKPGAYEVVDTSRNGVFLNDAAQPVGRGLSAPLKSGDRLRLGHYVFQATTRSGALSSFSSLYSDGPASGAGLETGILPPVAASRPPIPPFQSIPPMAGSPVGGLADVPPGSLWGERQPGEESLLESRFWESSDAPAERTPNLQRAPEQHDALPPFGRSLPIGPGPAAGEAPDRSADAARPAANPAANLAADQGRPAHRIPLDWRIAPDEEPSPSAPIPPLSYPSLANPSLSNPSLPNPPSPDPVGMVEPSEPPKAPPPRPGTPAAPPPAAGDAALMQAFLEGAGMDREAIGDRSDAEVMRAAGSLLREAVGGVARLLAARAQIKAEFRVERTMMAATGNNPLKFTPTVDEMLARVLGDPAPGYMGGVPALRDALRDIHAHEMALVSSIQTALDSLIQRFSPATLKVSLESGSFLLSSMLPSMRKARYWDVYELLYDRIAREVENDFHEVFGRSVAQTYTERLDGLNAADDR